MTDKTISIPIYDAALRIAVCDTYEQFEELVFETGYSEPLSGAGMIALRHEETTLFHIIINREDISVGNVAHECLHVTNKLMHHLGIEYDWHNDEAMCYLHGFLVDCVHKIIDNESRD
jgi:hypothetical protein